MNIYGKALSVLSAAVVAASAAAPLSAIAEDDDGLCSVTFHFEEFDGGSPFVMKCRPDATLSDILGDLVYNHDIDPVFLPEPQNGKAVRNWLVSGEENRAFDLDNEKITGDMELYPELAETVSPGTLTIEVDESFLPEAGKDIPQEAADAFFSVPEGADYAVTDAYYAVDAATFTEGRDYPLVLMVEPAEGKTFDFSYIHDTIRQLDIEGAEVNGSKASVIWSSSGVGRDHIFVILPIPLGEVERSKVTFDFNGQGDRESETVYIPSYEKNLFTYLSSADGMFLPVDDDHYFYSWYYDPELTKEANPLNLETEGDVTLYAGWGRYIDEVNLTIETPLCGDEVALDAEYNPYDEDTEYSMPLRYVFDEYISPDGRQEVENVFTNSPKVTCDVEGLDIAARWIVSDESADTMTPDSKVSLFQGEFRGENDYMFALAALDNSYEKAPPVFVKNARITVNGQEAKLNSSNYSFFSDRSKMGDVLNVYAYLGSKGGMISGMNTVYKGTNEFFVVGMITADHVWDEGVITLPAGCETDGTKTYTCRSKDASYDEEIDAYGHKWGEWVVIKPATEDEEGIEMRSCANDGEHTQTRAIPKLTPSEPDDSDDISSSDTDSSPDGGNAGNSGTGNGSVINNSGSQSQNQSTGAKLPIAAAVICAAAAVMLLIRKRK